MCRWGFLRQTAIEHRVNAALPSGVSRRQCLLAVAGAALWPGARAATPGDSATLVAAWEAESEYRVGLI